MNFSVFHLKYLFIFVFSICLSGSLSAKSAKFDEQLDLLKEKGLYQNALDLIEKQLSKETHLQESLALEKIAILRSNHRFQEVLTYINRIEKNYSKEIDQNLIIKLESEKVMAYLSIGKYDLAIIVANNLLDRIDKNDKAMLSSVYNFIGVGQKNLNLEKAESSFLKAISLKQEIDEINFASYNNLVDYYIMKKNYNATEHYLDTLMNLALKFDSKHDQISALTKKSFLLTKLNRGKEALEHLNKSNLLREKYGIEKTYPDYIFDARVLSITGQLDSAIYLCEQLIHHAIQNNEHHLICETMPFLAKCYANAGQPEKAVSFYEKFILIGSEQKKIDQIEKINSVQLAAASNSQYLWLALLLIPPFIFFFFNLIKNSGLIPSTAVSAQNAPVDKHSASNYEVITKTKLAHQQLLNFTKEIKKELRMLSREKSKLHQNVDKLVNRINQNLEFQDQWQEIHVLFEERFPQFTREIKNKIPNLTDSEMRHCIFVKLNISAEETAKVLGIEIASVNSARYRLRKKLKKADLVLS